jgi:predicted transcriptional regulator
MVELLGERPQSVSALADRFGITLTAVAQHLRLLEEAGLVRTEKLGRTRSCQLEPAGLARIQAWLSDRRSVWERRLDDLADFLDEED